MDQKAFDVAHKLTREPLPAGQPELADDEAVLEEAALVFDAPPDPFVLVVSIPSVPDGATIGFTEIENFVFVGVENAVKGQVVAPAIGPAAGVVVDVPPVEDNSFFFHWSFYKPAQGKGNFDFILPPGVIYSGHWSSESRLLFQSPSAWVRTYGCLPATRTTPTSERLPVFGSVT
jgi:hypothetical protein